MTMYRIPTARRAITAAGLVALTAWSISACGSDDAASDGPAPATEGSVRATEPTDPPTTEPAVTEPAVTEPAVTEPAVTEPDPTEVSASDAVNVASAALLRPDDVGEGWQDFGTGAAFPMTAELAASVPSCAAFVDVVFEGNNAEWAHTGLGRNMDIAFTSVAVFDNEADAAAMVAATATPEFDQCWTDFNEVAIVELPFGIESASYESVAPPDVELGGDSSSLHALEGTIMLGNTSVPDSCVCAFVQEGRTVVTFHSAAPIFSAATRRDVIAAALARVDETVS
jgi:hypothetical protein